MVCLTAASLWPVTLLTLPKVAIGPTMYRPSDTSDPRNPGVRSPSAETSASPCRSVGS